MSYYSFYDLILSQFLTLCPLAAHTEAIWPGGEGNMW